MKTIDETKKLRRALKSLVKLMAPKDNKNEFEYGALTAKINILKSQIEILDYILDDNISSRLYMYDDLMEV